MTAADYGMGLDAREPEPGAPQTARSDGMPFPSELLDVADLDSLDDARRHHVRRMAADAVDHLIALMDAIDAVTEDMEEDNHDGDPLDDGECDTADAEPSLGAPEMHCNTVKRVRDGWLSVNADQRYWTDGGSGDHEGDVADEPHDDEGEAEHALGWAANVSQLLLGMNTPDGDLTAPERHGLGFVRCGRDDHEDDDSGVADMDGLCEQLRLAGGFVG